MVVAQPDAGIEGFEIHPELALIGVSPRCGASQGSGNSRRDGVEAATDGQAATHLQVAGRHAPGLGTLRSLGPDDAEGGQDERDGDSGTVQRRARWRRAHRGDR